MAKLNLPKLPFQLPRLNLGPRTRRVLRIAGLVFFALFVFVFALQMTFPYGRVKDKLIEAMSDKYEVTIGGVERGWVPGRVYFKAVSIRTRQTKPEEVVTTFYIEKLELDAALLSLIGGTLSMDFEAKIGAGVLGGTVSVGKFGKGSISANISGSNLPGANLPMRAVLGLPMTGKIQFGVNLSLPVEKSKMGKTGINWQKAGGNISLSCPSGCTFGDGKTKLKPLLKNTRQQAMVGEGIDFGKVNLDSLLAKVSIKKGKLAVDKFDAKSKDGELKVDFSMTLDKEFGESMVAGCLRFKGSDDLLKREPKTYAALTTTGAEIRGDGLFHIRLTDRFKEMKRLNQECGPGTQINNGENFAGGGTTGAGAPTRPNLTVQPDEAAKAIPAPMPPSTTNEGPPPPPTPPGDAPPATPPGTAPGSAGSAGSAAPGSAAPPPPSPPPEGAPGAAPPAEGMREQPATPPTPPPE